MTKQSKTQNTKNKFALKLKEVKGDIYCNSTPVKAQTLF